MSKCFISYKTDGPERDIARYLEKFLSQHNHKVFIDTQIQIGKNWVREIEKHLNSSHFFIVLLSKESIRSDMVRQEVKLAHQLLKKKKTKFKILPIRVNFNGELPYDLGAYLDTIQYIQWTPDIQLDTIAYQILSVVENNEIILVEGTRDSGSQDVFMPKIKQTKKENNQRSEDKKTDSNFWHLLLAFYFTWQYFFNFPIMLIISFFDDILQLKLDAGQFWVFTIILITIWAYILHIWLIELTKILKLQLIISGVILAISLILYWGFKLKYPAIYIKNYFPS